MRAPSPAAAEWHGASSAASGTSAAGATVLLSRQASPPGPVVNGAVSCPVAHGLSHTHSTVPSVSLKPELSLALHWVVLGRCPLFSFIVYAPEGNCFAQSSGKQHFPPLLSLFISSDNCCRPGGPVLSPSHPPCRCLKSHPRVCACRQNPRRALPAGRGNRCFPARYPLTTYGSA